MAMGGGLRQEGYRGYFELDFLLDADTGDLWLGELNPRVTGASSITNVTAVAYGDMPLFLFHLLEFMDVDYEIDVDELNERWAQVQNLDEWTQFILKQTEDVTERITRAPRPGIWRKPDAGAWPCDHHAAMRMLPFPFRSIEELQLGERWRAVFDERWPHYREWFLREGEEARPSYAMSARMFRTHMPELVPAYERVVELAGGGGPAAPKLVSL